MSAALWDAVANAANLAQLSGLHAVTLVAVAASLVPIWRCTRECAELERCARSLRALLRWPTGGEAVMRRSELAGLVMKALDDADGLVEAYKKGTLWCRVRTSRSMVSRFRDMQNEVNSYCGLVLLVNGYLLLQSIHPQSDTTTA